MKLKPRICVSITAESNKSVVKAIRRVERHADLVEVRLDFLKENPNLKAFREATRLPLIATNRQVRQGGLFKGSERDRLDTLLRACEAGFDLVDLELTTENLEEASRVVKASGAELMVSHHEFKRTLSEREIEKIMNRELKFKPNVCKIVGWVNRISDNLAYLNFLSKMQGKYRLVCFGMGDLGVISRVLSPLFGADFTYASEALGREAAPGQIPVIDLRAIYIMLGVGDD